MEFALKALVHPNFRELCREYGISAKTGYKWRERFVQHGLAGLNDLSRRPHGHAAELGEAVVCEMVRLKQAHPHWGPRKIQALYQRKHGGEVPSESSFKRVLERAGLTEPRRVRRVTETGRLGQGRKAAAPNEVWSVDFKGWWRDREGLRVEPLTVRDLHSRYLLSIRLLLDQSWEPVRRIFLRLFGRYGYPRVIRVDNGGPFGSTGPAGLSRLSTWWTVLGISVEFIAPGHPEQNGGHEQMHRVMKAETTRPPSHNRRAQQRRTDRWVRVYNQVRPHEALGQQVPGSLYRPSLRSYPNYLPHPQYPAHFETRRAYPNGVISFGSTQWYVSACLADQLVGLEPSEGGSWRVHFGWVPIGLLDPRRAIEHRARNFGRLVPIHDSPRRRRPPYGR